MSPHERYVRLFTMVAERDESLERAFDDLRRSTALDRLAAMIALGVVTADDLAAFTADTRETATELAKRMGEPQAAAEGGVEAAARHAQRYRKVLRHLAE